jgi:hypothetical protein
MKEQREGFVQFPSCYGVTYKFQIKKPTRQQAFLILENRKTSQKW